MIIKVEDIRTLLDEDKIRYICNNEGYTLDKRFDSTGRQAAMYIVSKNNKEYVLKHYIGWRCGGYGGYIDKGKFKEEKYQKEIRESDDRFKIEKALATNEQLKNNEHIVNVLVADRATFDDGTVKLTEYYSIMEKYQQLSLDEEEPSICTEPEALRFGVQICDALVALQQCKEIYMEPSKAGGIKGIYHGDIKCDNIFYYQKNDKFVYVLADFGLSKLKGSQSSFSEVLGGTPYATAPELAKNNYSLKADLYALCATLYYLLNKCEEPKPRVEWIFNKFKVTFKGSMPPPKNCSTKMQALLVNGLEYKGGKRNCKSPEELKSALQRIQFNYAIETSPLWQVFQEVYYGMEFPIIPTLSGVFEHFPILQDIDNVTDPWLAADIGEFYLKVRCYEGASKYIDYAAEKNNPMGYYLLGTMYRDGQKYEKDLNKATAAFNRAIALSDATHSARKLAKNALKEMRRATSEDAVSRNGSRNERTTMKRKDNNNIIAKRKAKAKSRFSNKSILRLLILCIITVGGLGSCILSQVFMEYIGKENLVFVSSGVSMVLAYILIYLIWLSRSYYAWLVADVTCILVYMQAMFTAIFIWQLDIAIIIRILIEIVSGSIALCIMLITVNLDDEEEHYPVSSILINNYITSGVLIVLSAGMILFNNDISAIINLEWLQKDVVSAVGIFLAGASITFFIFKLLFYKEIKALSVKRSNSDVHEELPHRSFEYNFYRCRNCGQVIRVPKGKGTLKITCPKCGNSFVDQT